MNLCQPSNRTEINYLPDRDEISVWTRQDWLHNWLTDWMSNTASYTSRPTNRHQATEWLSWCSVTTETKTINNPKTTEYASDSFNPVVIIRICFERLNLISSFRIPSLLIILLIKTVLTNATRMWQSSPQIKLLRIREVPGPKACYCGGGTSVVFMCPFTEMLRHEPQTGRLILRFTPLPVQHSLPKAARLHNNNNNNNNNTDKFHPTTCHECTQEKK